MASPPSNNQDPQPRFYTAGNQPPAPPPRTPAPTPAPTPDKPPQAPPVAATPKSWPKMLFPAVLLMVIVGFALGVNVRQSLDWRDFTGVDLAVESTPPGATVFINGRLAGATPLRLEKLPAGDYALRLEKHGFSPAVERIALSRETHRHSTELQPLPSGRLSVTVLPDGAEVLLDGQLIGHTPLRDFAPPIGPHELVVRKTNFEPFAQRILVEKGKNLSFDGIGLEDKILAMLKRQAEFEPHRISHHVDLGHYLFVNNHMNKAAQSYAKAMELSAGQPVYPEGLNAEEKALEARLRSEDIRRLNSELRKKRHWRGKDTKEFKQRIEQVQLALAEKHLDNWTWIKDAAENYVKARKQDQAEQLYLRHIAAAPKSSTLDQAYIAVLDLRLRAKNLAGSREIANAFTEKYGKRADLLRQAANSLYRARGYFGSKDGEGILTMAENMLRQGARTSKRGELFALCSFELANVLVYQDRHQESLAQYDLSITQTADKKTRDLRRMRKASTLRTMNRYPDALAEYKQLLKSSDKTTRVNAQKNVSELERRIERQQEKDKKKKK